MFKDCKSRFKKMKFQCQAEFQFVWRLWTVLTCFLSESKYLDTHWSKYVLTVSRISYKISKCSTEPANVSHAGKLLFEKEDSDKDTFTDCVWVCVQNVVVQNGQTGRSFSQELLIQTTRVKKRDKIAKKKISVQFWCGFYLFSFLYDQLRPHRWWHLVKVSYCKTSPTHTEWCRLRPLQGKDWQHRISPNMWTAHLSELKCNTTWYPGPRGLD